MNNRHLSKNGDSRKRPVVVSMIVLLIATLIVAEVISL